MTGHVRKRGNKWAFVVELGRDEKGKRQQKWYSGFRTRKEAETERTAVLASMQAGGYVAPQKLTVAEYLERWLKDYAETNVAAKTRERYQEIIAKQITPRIGNVPLAKLQPLAIQGMYTALLQDGRADGKGGLSARSVHHVHRILSNALSQAVRWRLIPSNPCTAVEAPKPRRAEIQAIDEAESAALLEVAAGSRFRVHLLAAVLTGMRRGELLALRWEDVDLEGGKITVQRSLEQTRAGLAVKEPKSGRARKLSIPALLVDALRVHRQEQMRARALLKGDYGSAFGDLVFGQENGREWKPDVFSKAVGNFCRRVGLPLRLHSLRHSHASQLLAMGTPVKIVQERLGHSSSVITLDLYGHVLGDMGEQAAEKAGAALGAAMERRAGKKTS